MSKKFKVKKDKYATSIVNVDTMKFQTCILKINTYITKSTNGVQNIFNIFYNGKL